MMLVLVWKCFDGMTAVGQSREEMVRVFGGVFSLFDEVFSLRLVVMTWKHAVSRSSMLAELITSNRISVRTRTRPN